MTSQKKTYVTQILMIIGLVLPALIPVGSFALAQEQLKHFSSPHSISTSDFGIESPAGMAYSAEANSFIVWSADNALHIITSQEEMGGKINIAQSLENPLGMAFEDRSKSLFILSAGDTELAKIDTGAKWSAGCLQSPISPRRASTSAHLTFRMRRDSPLTRPQGGSSSLTRAGSRS